jgi:hypothetical protein
MLVLFNSMSLIRSRLYLVRAGAQIGFMASDFLANNLCFCAGPQSFASCEPAFRKSRKAAPERCPAFGVSREDVSVQVIIAELALGVVPLARGQQIRAFSYKCDLGSRSQDRVFDGVQTPVAMEKIPFREFKQPDSSSRPPLATASGSPVPSRSESSRQSTAAANARQAYRRSTDSWKLDFRT